MYYPANKAASVCIEGLVGILSHGSAPRRPFSNKKNSCGRGLTSGAVLTLQQSLEQSITQLITAVSKEVYTESGAMSFQRTPLMEVETISAFEATLLREKFESNLRSTYLTNVCVYGPIFYCIFYPCAKRQARIVAESWRFYVTEDTLIYQVVNRSLFGISYPKVYLLLALKS